MAKFNEIIHNNIKYNVWVKDGSKGQQTAHIYKEGDKTPVAGTTFGGMASFENDIMGWAKRFIDKNFPRLGGAEKIDNEHTNKLTLTNYDTSNR